MTRIAPPRSVWALLTFLLTCCLLHGCGTTPSGADSWLVILSGDTITVSEAAEAWAGLSPREKEIFVVSPRPSREFVSALATKRMLEREVSALGITDAPGLRARAEADARTRKTRLLLELLRKDLEERVTPEDMEFFLSHMGTSVWFTETRGDSVIAVKGPEHLPMLRKELVLILDGMLPGEETETPWNTSIRLDSIYRTDPELVEATLADTDRVNGLARSRLAEARLGRMVDSVLTECRENGQLRLDSANIEIFVRDPGMLPGTALITSSAYGDLTGEELTGEIAFLSISQPVRPEDPSWLDWWLHRRMEQTCLAAVLEDLWPAKADSIVLDRAPMVMELAVDSLYTLSVTEAVTVTSAEIVGAYERMRDTLLIEEHRVFEMPFISEWDIDSFRDGVILGRDPGFVESLDGLGTLVQEAGSRLTRPVPASAIPLGLGAELFRIDPADTGSWHGPYSLDTPPGFFAARLVEVIPEHEASLDEASSYIEGLIRTRREAQRLDEWLEELGTEHGLLINEELLTGLPGDPGLWSSL